MKLFQETLKEIQEITGKEYDVEYSNNAESEYVTIYSMETIEDMINDLLEVAKNG